MVKNPPAIQGSTPGPGRSPGEGNGDPLQYSCLEYPMDRGAWQATVHGVAKESDTTEYLLSSHLLHFHSTTLRDKILSFYTSSFQ